MKTHLALALAGAALIALPAAAQTTATPDTTTKAQADKAPAMYEMKPGQWRATKLTGVNVYNNNNEKIGDVNELIVGRDGKVEAVVIGVGGFLGLGEKDVAVKMDQITVQPEDANKSNVRLILASTKADLEAAPEFKSVAAQNREMNSNTGSTTMPAAPATPPASTGTTNQ